MTGVVTELDMCGKFAGILTLMIYHLNCAVHGSESVYTVQGFFSGHFMVEICLYSRWQMHTVKPVLKDTSIFKYNLYIKGPLFSRKLAFHA